MKSTDIIKPVAMATPIAVSGSKDTIPQEQTDVEFPWYCSIEKGFPDVTMTALNQGGKPPRGQGMNALLYRSSDQKVYLQNGGILTFDEDVSDAIGGYPQGAILDYVNDGVFKKIQSLIDDNTYNFITNPEYIDNTHWKELLLSASYSLPIATDSTLGGVKIGDGIYIDDDGAISTDNADKDINNLSNLGNARLQYAPFSINDGTINNGQNATLGSQISYKKYNYTAIGSLTNSSGVLSGFSSSNKVNLGNFPANTTSYECCIKFKTSSPSTKVDICGSSSSGSSSAYYVPQLRIESSKLKFLSPSGTGITSSTTIQSNTWYWVKIIWTGTKKRLLLSTDGLNYTTEGTYTTNRTLHGGGMWLGSGYGEDFQLSFSNGNIDIKESYIIINNEYWWQGVVDGTSSDYDYTIGGASSITCAPCTITTTDGRTRIFDASATYDVSDVSNGSYSIFKDYSTGALTLMSGFSITKTAPINVNITGTLTNNNGVLSDFSSGNYAQMPSYPSNLSSFEIQFKFKTPSALADGGRIFSASATNRKTPALYFLSGGSLMFVASVDGTAFDCQLKVDASNLSTDTEYIANIKWNGTKITGTLTDMVGNVQNFTVNSGYTDTILTVYWAEIMDIGIDRGSSSPYQSSIDLKESYVKINGSYFWLGVGNHLNYSTVPANMYFNSAVNNDLVYIGDCEVSSSAISTYTNNYINACPYHRDLVESYTNGHSWYAIYSDGWCEQGGGLHKTVSGSDGATTVDYLKPFINIKYTLVTNVGYNSSSNQSAYRQPYTKTISGFTYNRSSDYIGNWLACGYIK